MCVICYEGVNEMRRGRRVGRKRWPQANSTLYVCCCMRDIHVMHRVTNLLLPLFLPPFTLSFIKPIQELWSEVGEDDSSAFQKKVI